MNRYSRSHLDDHALKLSLGARAGAERAATADVLADIAEFDARRLFAPAGYDSMYAYCLQVLKLSDDEATLRIRAARAARQFPVIFPALAEGRLSLTAVYLLSRHLTADDGQDLLAAALDKTKAQVQLLLAERFPQPDLPSRLTALPTQPGGSTGSPVPERVNGHAPGPIASRWPKVAPLSPGRFALQETIAQDTHEKLRYAQALLGHAVPTGAVAEVLDRALDALIAQLEKQKFAVTSRPRSSLRSSADPRHIPAHVKRAVLERDGGECTFVGENGHRCGSRKRLEFDHVDPVALGGEATVDGIRLRCRAHNQYEAECIFGAGFMESKREAARLARDAARQEGAAEKRRAAAEKVQAAAAEKDPDRSVIPWLRGLGYRLEEARELATVCETIPDASMEEKIKLALRYSRSRAVARGAATCPGAAG